MVKAECRPIVEILAGTRPLLAGFVGRAVAPRATGQPYVKER